MKQFEYKNEEYGIEHGLLYKREAINEDLKCWTYKTLEAEDTNNLYLRASFNGWTHNIEDSIERFHSQGHGARKNRGWRA